MNHKDAWAEDFHSPTKNEVQSVADSTTTSTPTKGRRIIVGKESPKASEPSQNLSSEAHSIKTDTLVVVSKVKKLIKEQSGMSTSQCCVDALTKKVISECLKGIEEAKKVDRKTVMGRDIK